MGERAGESVRTVEVTGAHLWLEVDLPVAPDRAWALVTERRHVAEWWGGHVELEARPGGRLRETWSDGGRRVVTSGVVVRCEPPSVLELTWADDDWPGETAVAFELSARGGGTRLRLRHSGWYVHPPDRRPGLIGAHAEGWRHHLARLVGYAAEVGRPV